MEIFKIVVVAIASCIICLLVKQIKPEFFVVVLISVSVLMILYVLKYFVSIFYLFNEIVDKTGIDGTIFMILIKIIGIGYLIEFGASICEDSGNSSISSKLLLAGKISIFVLSMPIISNLFELLMSLI